MLTTPKHKTMVYCGGVRVMDMKLDIKIKILTRSLRNLKVVTSTPQLLPEI